MDSKLAKLHSGLGMLPPKGMAMTHKEHWEYQAGRCVQAALGTGEWLEQAATSSWEPGPCGVATVVKCLSYVSVISNWTVKLLWVDTVYFDPIVYVSINKKCSMEVP